VEAQMKKIQSDLPNLATDLVAPSSSVPLMRSRFGGCDPRPDSSTCSGEELKEETNANFVQ